MSERKTVAEMIGEACREIGVLIGVFAPLDAVFYRGVPVIWTTSVVILGVSWYVAGMLIERIR